MTQKILKTDMKVTKEAAEKTGLYECHHSITCVRSAIDGEGLADIPSIPIEVGDTVSIQILRTYQSD